LIKQKETIIPEREVALCYGTENIPGASDIIEWRSKLIVNMTK
jgi:hypothetical protein